MDLMSSQSVEWSVLESIHPTICISNEDAIVTLLVPVELGIEHPVHIFHVPHDSYLVASSFSTDVPSHSASLSVLPPLHFRITLPPTYPTLAPPIIQSLRATSAWLPPPTLSLIKERIATMWSPGDDSGVLYTWVEWIRTGDFLAEVGLLGDDRHSIQYLGTSILPLPSFVHPILPVRIPHPSPQLLLTPLHAYASSSKSDEFAHTSYLCAICLSERKGIHCLALSCGHVFCRSCLVDMWGLHVKEGQVSRVGCPEPNCGKSDAEGADGLREVTEDEARAVLSENELDRWKWLRRKRDLERDPTMIYCPMEYCQEPVTKPKSDNSRVSVSDEDEYGWARLRTCTACGYSFCAFCARTWHGPHTPCPLPLTSTFLSDYLSAPRDSPERRVIERRYGRSNVLELVRQHEDDQKNRKWLDSSTTTCPSCEVKYEKSMGCNHMTCVKCGAHFCYRCGTKLHATDPYQHFSTPGKPCFSMLFD